MFEVCWACNQARYHDYNDKHGIRCPSCGQKEKDDPKKAKPIPVINTEPPAKKAAVKRTTTRRK